MTKHNDLTQGSIRRGIFSVSIPLITASFVQMAYSLTDMIWLGRLGSESVAAVGAAGFFAWLCNSLSFVTKVGAEVTISQSLGAKENEKARIYANQATMLSILISLCYAIFIFLTAKYLVSFFHLEADILSKSINYLKIIAPGIFLVFNSNTFSGIYNGQGNSMTPLKIVAIGLGCNIILDPIFIFSFGFIPRMEVAGAATATVISQFIVYAIFIHNLYIKKSSIGKLNFFTKLKGNFIERITKLGLPVCLQSGLFAIFSLTLASLASRWGHIGVAVLSIGSQIEAITWMTAGGFSTALAAFTGQNFGARNFVRIKKGYHFTLILSGSISLFASICFIFFAKELFGFFVSDPETLPAGIDYLRILAISQVFMSIEQVTTGVFNGCGKTVPPAISGIILTGSRIPLAYLFITFTSLGLNGIWWSITISSVLKGIILVIWFKFFERNLKYSLEVKNS